jgi:hypothetical protein
MPFIKKCFTQQATASTGDERAGIGASKPFK